MNLESFGFEVEKCVKKKTVDPLQELLEQSKGYPVPSSVSTKLQHMPESQFADSILGGVYWIQPSPEFNVDSQWWYESLTCKPLKNGLAPSAPASFKVFYSHSTKPGWIGVPKFRGLSLFGKPTQDLRSQGEDANLTFSASRELRDYQMKAVTSTLKTLEEWGGATIIADCGAGKTAIALKIASCLQRKTLVICNRSFLMHQWKHEAVGKKWTWSDDNTDVDVIDPESAVRFKCKMCRLMTVDRKKTGFPVCTCGFGSTLPYVKTSPPKEGWLLPCRTGWLQASVEDWKDKDIVFASIDSLAQGKFPKEVLDKFGLVIVDEMHHLCARTLSQVLPLLSARYILGVSATPDRADGLEHVLYWLAGPTSFVYKRIPSITGITGSVIVRRCKFTGGKREEVVYRNGSLGFASTVSKLASDEVRNAYILQLISSCTERAKILVVTSIVFHAQYLCSILKEANPSICMIHGGCSKESVQYAKSSECKMVVATFQFLEEGYDDDAIDTLFLAMPRSKVQQVVGRVERTREGKLTPVVYDIIDTFSLFENMGKKRNTFYKSRGFTLC